MAKVKTFRTVDEAVKKGEVFAVNVSDKNKTQPKGDLIFHLGGNDGDSNVIVNIPRTWIPFDLTEYSTLADIEKSTSLRSLMRQGLLVLITEESFEALLKDPNYPNEMENVRKSMRNFNADLGPESMMGDEVDINTGDLSLPESTMDEDASKEETKPNTIEEISQSDKVKMAELIALNSQDNKEALLTKASETFGDFTDHHFIYMTEKIGDQSSFLYLLAADAITAVRETNTVDVMELPAYEEYVAAKRQ